MQLIYHHNRDGSAPPPSLTLFLPFFLPLTPPLFSLLASFSLSFSCTVNCSVSAISSLGLSRWAAVSSAHNVRPQQCLPFSASPLRPFCCTFYAAYFPLTFSHLSFSLSRSVSLQFPWWAISQMRSCSMCRLRMVAAVAASRQTHPSIRCSATKWDALSAAAVASGVNSIHKVNRDR